MELANLPKKLMAAAALAAVAVLLCGCLQAEPVKPGKSEPKQGSQQENSAEKGEKTKPPAEPDAGESTTTTASGTSTYTGVTTVTSGTLVIGSGETPPAAKEKKAVEAVPLVDNMADLVKIDHCSPAWIDKKHKEVVLVGETCKAGYPLEFFATLPDRAYESVVVVSTPPSIVHAALIVLGAKPGHPVRFDPKFEPATGTEIAIEVRWKDKNGKVQSAPAQQWIRNIQTKKALDTNWVFAGSMLIKDSSGRKRYVADGGDFVSVLNLPTATLDLPIRSTHVMDARLFEGFVENMPPDKTPVTILLKPKLEKKAASGPDTEMQKWMQDVQKAGKGDGKSGSGADSVFPPSAEDKDKTEK